MADQLQVAQVNLAELNESQIVSGVRELEHSYWAAPLHITGAEDFLDIVHATSANMSPSGQARVTGAMDRIDGIVQTVIRARRFSWAPERVEVSAGPDHHVELGGISVIASVEGTLCAIESPDQKTPQIWEVRPEKLLVVAGTGRVALSESVKASRKNAQTSPPITVISGPIKRY